MANGTFKAPIGARKIPANRHHVFCAFLWLTSLGIPALPAQTVALPKVVVSTTRSAESPEHVPFAATVVPAETLRATPVTTLDGTLRSLPAFSLFRRSDSLSANPTAQGVSLRGLGPSGASRSLVLLDGVPLNDPFGGWVAWTKVPRESLAGAELVRGGGATAWGNAALGGIVQLISDRPSTATGRIAASYGEFDTHNAEIGVNQPLGPGALQVLARDFGTDGFILVAPEDRGPIDIPAASEHRWLAGSWRQAFGSGLEATVTARTYEEDRNNGTPFQRNSTEEDFVSLALAAKPTAAFSWHAVAYGQDQAFASTFSSVNASRTAETPASDQYDVPATAFGAAWTGVWTAASGARTSAGLDYRRVEGETRENYTYVAGNFTRNRIAGGTQGIGGLFGLHEWSLGPDVRATLGARVDFWSETEGHRREMDRNTGTVLRDDRYADRDDVEFSPSAGLVWTVSPGWRLRTAAQYSFRRPTLNELYRPFRVGNVITEANSALETEHALSAEVGVERTAGPVTFGAALFWNELTDAVGNVTLYRGPGTFPIVGFVPAGGVGRQRLNLDRVRVRGLELSAQWTVSPTLALRADWLANDATVEEASAAPALVGKQLAQVPEQSGSFGATWQPVRALSFHARVRYLGRQFEDDENLLVLGTAVVTDLGATYDLTPHVQLFANAENLTDERIETGRSADGIVNTGTPRLVFGGARVNW
jgi:outer membrane receptor protein involved in Fe transport